MNSKEFENNIDGYLKSKTKNVIGFYIGYNYPWFTIIVFLPLLLVGYIFARIFGYFKNKSEYEELIEELNEEYITGKIDKDQYDFNRDLLESMYLPSKN